MFLNNYRSLPKTLQLNRLHNCKQTKVLKIIVMCVILFYDSMVLSVINVADEYCNP